MENLSSKERKKLNFMIQSDYVHKGTRSFNRNWQLSDDVKVNVNLRTDFLPLNWVK